ncbi:MAG TPA: CmpA/NrtA family ABC transporter substrate-binding protein [Planctomycetota bacterium]|nr:CmpA/NrtA family ABC transporter substrate-binding protein [Planctomycetota bacterium]
MKTTQSGLTRRDLLRSFAAVSVAAGVGRLSTATVRAAEKLEKTDLTLGFIPLTDCAPLVIASEKGIYKKYGLNVAIKKMASWAATRDAIQKNEIQGAHILLGMIVGSSLGVGDVNSPVKKVPMCVLQMLNLNGQAITLKKSLLDAGIKTPADIKKAITEKGMKLTFAMTFPPGTHAMWTRYWLAAGGVHPDKDVKLITIPPPQMVANMKTGNMDGYCVGEPWGARAVAEGIGGTGITTQGIWKDHPEKVLGVTEEFAKASPNTCKALIAATLEACRWLDDLKNRPEAAEIIGRQEYVNCKPDTILDRMLGKYIHAPGASPVDDPDYMRFFERNTPVPYLSHAMWFMSQHRRWGMLAEKPDYQSEARRIMRQDYFTDGAKMAEVALPAGMESRGKETLFDGMVFDPADPEAYWQQFGIKA